MKIEKFFENCTLCPRMCRVNRMAGETGFCSQKKELVVARAALHMWEEPCLSGSQGSGTVFFSGCSLRCIYCQNRSIAKGEAGEEISWERLAQIFLDLQNQGANNINLVTPSHFLPYLLKAIPEARQKGLTIPMVYNTGGYERAEILRLLDGYIDVYLPDFKYMDEELAAEYSYAPDYPEYAKKAIEEMVRQTGGCMFDEQTGMIKKGVIVRHLVLPGHTKDSKQVIQYLHRMYGEKIFLSLMSQYTPMEWMKGHPLLGRKITKREYERVVDYALEIGVQQGFIQEGDVAKESFIPDFDGTGVESKI